MRRVIRSFEFENDKSTTYFWKDVVSGSPSLMLTLSLILTRMLLPEPNMSKSVAASQQKHDCILTEQQQAINQLNAL